MVPANHQPMWPWGHLAVAYLSYVVLRRVPGRPIRGKQTLGTLLAVAVGSQLPDLVDKPLAWSVGLLPSGRSLAHSLLTAAVVIAIAYRLSQRVNREELVAAFAVGWVSHSLSDLGPDVILGLLSGDWSQLQWMTYLVWPLLPSPPYPHDDSFVEHFAALVLDPYMGFQIALVAIAVGVWAATGMTGLRETYRWLQGRRASLSQRE